MGVGPSTPVSVTSVSGCPPITLTTSTTTIRPVVTSYTTSTNYVSLGSATDTVYVTETTTASARTTTTLPPTTLTTTSTSIIDQPATSTVNVPTAPDFTPVLCEATFYNPVVTSYLDTYTYPGTILTYVTTSVSGYETVSTSTVYEYSSTSTYTYRKVPTSVVTVTTTTTLNADGVTTIYDACATNNIATSFPNDQGSIPFAVTNNNNITYVNVPAIDVVDCCAQCQSDSTCFGSAFEDQPSSVNFQPLTAPCKLFIPIPGTNTTCDPQLISQKVAFPLPGQPALYYVSNSPCGQYLFDTSEIEF